MNNFEQIEKTQKVIFQIYAKRNGMYLYEDEILDFFKDLYEMQDEKYTPLLERQIKDILLQYNNKNDKFSQREFQDILVKAQKFKMYYESSLYNN